MNDKCGKPNPETEKNKKTATDNQWISTGKAKPADESIRRDGPGGENR